MCWGQPLQNRPPSQMRSASTAPDKTLRDKEVPGAPTTPKSEKAQYKSDGEKPPSKAGPAEKPEQTDNPADDPSDKQDDSKDGEKK